MSDKQAVARRSVRRRELLGCQRDPTGGCKPLECRDCGARDAVASGRDGEVSEHAPLRRDRVAKVGDAEAVRHHDQEASAVEEGELLGEEDCIRLRFAPKATTALRSDGTAITATLIG